MEIEANLETLDDIRCERASELKDPSRNDRSVKE